MVNGKQTSAKNPNAKNLVGKPCASPEQVCREFNKKNAKKGNNMTDKKPKKTEETKKPEPVTAPVTETDTGEENAPDLVKIEVTAKQFDAMKNALVIKEELSERAQKIGKEIADKKLASANRVVYKDNKSWGIQLNFTDGTSVSYPKTSRTKKLLFELGLGEDPAIEAKRWRSNYSAKKAAEKKDAPAEAKSE